MSYERAEGAEIYKSYGSSEWKDWEASERLNFVKKVYGIVGTQLLVTALTCIIPFMNPETTFFRN